MLYDEQDAEDFAPKVEAAAKRLRLVNSKITIESHVIDLNNLNAEALLGDVDLVLDGSDNFSVRFLINDTWIKLTIPWIYGGAVSSRGVALTILPGKTPCLRCLFPQAPAPGTSETCDTAGVIGGIIHVVASFQATEALKLLVGDMERLNTKMQQWDLWYNQFTSIHVASAHKKDCPACVLHKFDYLDQINQENTIQTLCGRNSVQIHPVEAAPFLIEEWGHRLKPLGPVERNRFLLRFRPSPDITFVLFQDGRALVQGTDDPTVAKSLYSRYIGMKIHFFTFYTTSLYCQASCLLIVFKYVYQTNIINRIKGALI